MNFLKTMLCVCGFGLVAASCSQATQSKDEPFKYTVDEFADIQVLRYRIPGWDSLSLQQKAYIYHLSEAGKCGRDILFSQNFKYNLAIRKMLEKIISNYDGDRECEQWQKFLVYAKRVFFSNGIHHHYAEDKIIPECTEEYFKSLLDNVKADKSSYTYIPVMFDPALYPQRKYTGSDKDIVANSAVNFYGDGVTRAEADKFYAAMEDPKDPRPLAYGINTRLVKKDGKLVEEVYKAGGRFSNSINAIIIHLEKAAEYAENDAQRDYIALLIEYYRTGDLKTWDDYNVAWVQENQGQVDFINGFIEDYNDPLGRKATWESSVNFKDIAASRRTQLISDNAQWFEDNSPVDGKFKKKEVKGVTAKVINVACIGGDCFPATPIGINLPNANWIRAAHGSKSVTIENITQAYDEASQGNGFNEEFVIDEPTRELMKKYLFITDNLHTDLHECLGHGSGKLLPGVDPDALKAHGSTLEETRADLFALYYLADPKLVELGLLDNKDAYKAEFYKFMLNGMMTQLMRIEPGKDVEEAHMRNRKLIAEWAYEMGREENVVELAKINGKTFIKINDYDKLREIFGKQLAEIQRIKSEGDYEAGRILVEKYAVKVDPQLHKEILDRYASLTIAPYRGFVNPIYTPVINENGEIIDITLDFTEGYINQMLRYSRDYSPLTKK